MPCTGRRSKIPSKPDPPRSARRTGVSFHPIAGTKKPPANPFVTSYAPCRNAIGTSRKGEARTVMAMNSNAHNYSARSIIRLTEWITGKSTKKNQVDTSCVDLILLQPFVTPTGFKPVTF
ncbi:MAG: hypothetical protein LBJ23_04220 [Tannerella sp.]|nr:hypothetical protein [Tannerella sp.]